MSPHLKRIAPPNYSKVRPKPNQKKTQSKKMSFLNSFNGTPTSTKSKQSKLYNPEVDKIKIVEGDLFDVRERIGLR